MTMNKESKVLIQKLIDHIMIDSLHTATIKKYMRVLVGSYAIGTETPASDIDLLCVYDWDYPHSRFKKKIFDKDVSVCFIPIEIMEEDGAERKYWWYYSVKCLNPTQTFSHDEYLRKRILVAAWEFIGPLSSYIASTTQQETFTKDEITIHTFMAYMWSNYWYISYFLSYFLATNFLDIRENLVEKISLSLSHAQIITHVENKYRYANPIQSYEHYHYTRLVISSVRAAYWWHVHDQNHTFQKDYYANAEMKMKDLNKQWLSQQTIIDFFKQKAILKKLII